MRFTLIWIWVRLISLLVPRAQREAWVHEWYQELSQRVPPRPFHNIFRDALFARRQTPSREPAESPLSRILVVESLALAAATILWTGYTYSPQPPPCGSNLDRIAFVQRSYAAMGIALSSVTWRLEQQLQKVDAFEGIASFRIRYGFDASAQVSRSLFDLMGVKAELGRTFDRDSTLDSVILTWSLWQDRFKGDPGVLGQRAWFDDRFLKITGVLPANFVFASRRVRHFTPLIEGPLTAGVVVKLRPGVTLDEAQRTLRQIAPRFEEGWKPEAYRLQPYLQTVKWRDTALPGLIVAAVCWIGASLFLYWRMRGGPLYYAALGGRFLFGILALSEVFSVTGHWAAANLIPLAIVHLWFFTIACSLVFALIVRDHLNRCPVCLAQLRMPTGFGTWGSLMMDVPGIGYVCPKGHGWLHRDGGGNGRSRWNRLDSSWRDLFVR